MCGADLLERDDSLDHGAEPAGVEQRDDVLRGSVVRAETVRDEVGAATPAAR